MSNEKSDNLKKIIASEICDFVRKASNESGRSNSQSYMGTTKWGTPRVGFADAFHPSILSLKEVISSAHSMPTDVLSDASIILAYYVPFTKELADTNKKSERLASPEWALAYEQTNAMFGVLNTHIISFLSNMGYRAAASKETATFDRKKLISNWSHRHLAYTAGLGTFGLNNMLITKSGCCGRYFTLVTNLDVQPDEPLTENLCLYKKNGNCGICVKNCPVGALRFEGYDRQKCYTLIRENAEIYTEFGSSYIEDTSVNAKKEGSEVCGKCVAALPCAFWNIP